MRKRYSAELKAKIALDAIREKETLNKLASRHGVSRVQIQNWKKLALKGIPGSFARKKPDEDEKDKLIDSLYREIGKLKVEKDWLKKKYESFNE